MDSVDLRAFYKTNGYVIVRNFFNKEEVVDIFDQARTLFAKQIERITHQAVDIYNQDEFEQKMAEFFNKDFDAFIHTGKQVQHLIALHRLGTDARIVSLLKDLGLQNPIISVRPAMMFNSKSLAKKQDYWKLDAHQDWRGCQGSLDSVVMWFPLTDCNADLGALQVLPKSHKKGLYEGTDVDYISNIKEPLDDKEFEQLELNVGDILVFSTFTVHRSGTNITPHIRWTCQFRFNNIDEGTFVERGFPLPYIYRPTPDLLFPGFPKQQQVAELFEKL